MATKETTETKGYKPGAYICVVDGEGFAYFNKRAYSYGDRVVVESQELVDKLMGSGPRFIPEEEFSKRDRDVVHKIISASKNNKSVEDIVRSTEAEKKQMKADYEAEIAKLKEQLSAKAEAAEKEVKLEAEVQKK